MSHRSRRSAIPLEGACHRGTGNKIRGLARPLNTNPIHPYTIHTDGIRMETAMIDNIREFRPKPPETEKITINLGYVDLGHVDLMVQEGFYSNRTDFIRTAIR